MFFYLFLKAGWGAGGPPLFRFRLVFAALLSEASAADQGKRRRNLSEERNGFPSGLPIQLHAIHLQIQHIYLS